MIAALTILAASLALNGLVGAVIFTACVAWGVEPTTAATITGALASAPLGIAVELLKEQS